MEHGLIWSSQLMAGFRGVQAGKLWHNDVNVMPMRRWFMMVMIMMMWKLTKRAKEMRKKERIWCWWWWWQQWLWQWKMSRAETETTICLQAMQISKSVSHCNLDFSLIKHSALFHAQSLGTDRDRNIQRAMLGLKTKWLSAAEDQVISHPCRRPPAYKLVFSLYGAYRCWCAVFGKFIWKVILF